MSLEQKVGQMTQAERADVAADPSEIAESGLGSVLSGGGSVPTPNTPEAWADMVDSYQEAALGTELGIPLLYGVDSVHGHGNLQGATVFPHNIGLGATRNPELVETIAHITAIETRATGPQWAFAPCVCVARDDRWGRTYESFGESPALARSSGTAAIDGLQGRPGQLDRPDRVLATAKHFAGDGLTTYGTGEGDYTVDQGIDEVSRADFDRLALAPYKPAVRRAPRRLGHAVVLQRRLDRGRHRQPGQDACQPRADHRRAQGRDRLRRVRDLRLAGDPAAPGQLPRARSRPPSTPGVDMFMEPDANNPDQPNGWRSSSRR